MMTEEINKLRESFEDVAYRQYFYSDVKFTLDNQWAESTAKPKSEWMARKEDGSYVEDSLNVAWWAWQAASKNSQEEIEDLNGIIKAYERDLEKGVNECEKVGIGAHSYESAVSILAFKIYELEDKLQEYRQNALMFKFLEDNVAKWRWNPSRYNADIISGFDFAQTRYGGYNFKEAIKMAMVRS